MWIFVAYFDCVSSVISFLTNPTCQTFWISRSTSEKIWRLYYCDCEKIASWVKWWDLKPCWDWRIMFRSSQILYLSRSSRNLPETDMMEIVRYESKFVIFAWFGNDNVVSGFPGKWSRRRRQVLKIRARIWRCFSVPLCVESGLKVVFFEGVYTQPPLLTPLLSSVNGVGTIHAFLRNWTQDIVI